MELKDLLGKHLLSGVQFGNMPPDEEVYSDAKPKTVDFVLDGRVISVIEDPVDDCRSCMKDIVLDREGLVITNTFAPVEVIGKFREDDIEDDTINYVIDFTDVITGWVVLSVGTGNTEDYYPFFVGEWKPEYLCINQKERERLLGIIQKHLFDET